MTYDDFCAIPVGQTIRVVEADLAFFLYADDRCNKKAKPLVCYDPVNFFLTCVPIVSLQPTGEIKKNTEPVLSCRGSNKPVERTVNNLYTIMTNEKWDLINKPHICVYVDGDPYISNGSSGYGFSRYIAFDRLEHLPQFFFRDTPGNLYDYVEEPESEYETEGEEMDEESAWNILDNNF